MASCKEPLYGEGGTKKRYKTGGRGYSAGEKNRLTEKPEKRLNKHALTWHENRMKLLLRAELPSQRERNKGEVKDSRRNEGSSRRNSHNTHRGKPPNSEKETKNSVNIR